MNGDGDPVDPDWSGFVSKSMISQAAGDEHLAFVWFALAAASAGVCLLLGMLKRTLTITLDFDWFWRGGGRALAREFDWRIVNVWSLFVRNNYRAAKRFVETVYRHHGPEGILAKTRPTGTMAFWMTIMLAAYFVFYLV